MMPGVNYVIYGCLTFHCSLTFQENTVVVATQDRMIDDNLKKQIKNKTLCTCRLFLLT